MKKVAQTLSIISVIALCAFLTSSCGPSRSSTSGDVKEPYSNSSGEQKSSSETKDGSEETTIEEKVVFNQDGVKILKSLLKTSLIVRMGRKL
ncbi:MAG: hypothetical protein IKQ69_01355 [Oscillospiraceae bacterium]|nr:hypothetical protein [Oscillospiraceae bacterium]